ncbi:Uncharacterised protein [Vibrio cholerae]|nr:Uncharacterised protein [Vibrio cholerae]CSB36828.1 Uncharacterised protein [Vibrio cholerae]CSI55072.1 Uncharacterised protein [Vibrio cholerae]
MTRFERIAQSRDIDHSTAGGVNEDSTRFHARKLFRTHHIFSASGFRNMQ